MLGYSFGKNGGIVYARRQSGGLFFANATDTRAFFDTEETQLEFYPELIGLTYDGVINQGRFTNTSSATISYLVTAQVNFAVNPTGIRFAWFRLNGDAGNRLGYNGVGADAGGDITALNCSTIMTLAPGQFFEFWAYQTSGGLLEVGGSGGGVNTGYGLRIQIARLN